jgi:hypothetical protein
VKYLRPDIPNAVHEISKMLDFPCEISINEFLRDVEYTSGTQDIGLKISPVANSETNIMTVVGCSDSNCARNKHTRILLTGIITYFLRITNLSEK